MEVSSDGQTGNAIKLPAKTAELGVIINSKQTDPFTPGDLGPEKPAV